MIFIITAAVLALAIYIFLQQPSFGKLPTGERLERIKKSPNFRDGEFKNLHETPSLTGGVSYFTVLKEFFFNKSKRNVPESALPSKKVDLLNLDPKEEILVWFGHSSVFIQTGGKKFLIDPVFSGHASPLSFTTKSFKGTNIYTADEMPAIDYLLVSHDHWDHLDYETMLLLKPKIKKLITGLGVGAHLEHWGFNPATIIEKDWNEKIELEQGFTIYTAPARHFSGRGLKRNQSLWLSFILYTPDKKIYIGGDSGYDEHFKTIGKEHGPFDLALLECGQYNAYWKYIHMMPEEVSQAAIDLQAKKVLPVHWAKFSLALHDWDEPIIRLSESCKLKGVQLITPRLGEALNLTDKMVAGEEWWLQVK